VRERKKRNIFFNVVVVKYLENFMAILRDFRVVKEVFGKKINYN
jgi:hypothetical protein